MLILLSLALAAPPSSESTAVVSLAPEVVWTMLGDVRRWPTWTDLGGEGVRVTVRGEPYQPGQTLLWSDAAGRSGRIELSEVDASRVAARVLPSRPPAPWGGPWLLEPHEVSVDLVPLDAGGTSIRWHATSTTRLLGAVGARGRVERAASTGLSSLAAELAQLPDGTPEPVEPPAPLATSDVLGVWRGYHHRWTYNHRINRHGDWLEPPACAGDGCEVVHVHAAASGTGVDRARTTSYASLISAPGLHATYGTSRLWFDGREGELLSDEACRVVPDAPADATVILAGFDADSVGSADSLWELGLGVRTRTRDDGQTEVCADGEMRMACRTPECGAESLTTYDVPVRWVLFSAPGLRATPLSFGSTRQVWLANDIRDEVVPAPRVMPNAPDAATVGLQRFSVRLDHPLHTLGLDIAARPSDDGTVAVDLAFVPWGPVEIAPLTVAQFAKSGSAELSIDAVAIGLPGACFVDVEVPSEVFWPGNDRDASGPDAESRSSLHFEPGACRVEPLR